MKLKNIKFLYSFFILILYLFLGTLLLFKYLGQEVPSLTMALFGIIVMAYGLFRGYRAYRTYRNSNEEQDEVE